MKAYKIYWTREQKGTNIIRANTEEKAEEKAETGEHEKINILGNDFENWTISDIKEI